MPEDRGPVTASPAAAAGGPPPDEGDPAPRLTIGGLWRDFVQRFLNLEQGLLHTVRGMATRPGKLARLYVDGYRRAYVNPFTYLIFAYLITFGVLALLGYENLVVEEMRHRFAEQAAEGGRLVPRQLEESMVQALGTMLHNSHFVSIVICIPFALLLRLAFRASGINLAEAFVFALFAFAQSSLVGSLYLLRFLLPGQQLNTMHQAVASLTITVLVAGWMAVGFFGRSWKSVAKTTLALAGGYAAFFVVQISLIVGYTVYLLTSAGLGAREPTLFVAAERNEVRLAESLVAAGADVDRPSGATPLHVAAERGHLEMVRFLLHRGADPGVRDHLGRTPLEVAVDERHAAVASHLIAGGSDVDAARDGGRTVLMTAVARRLYGVAAELLAGGADPDAVRDDERATALMLAADRGDRRSVELLLAHGADPAIRNRDGQTAADFAESDGLRRLLSDAGARAVDGPPADGALAADAGLPAPADAGPAVPVADAQRVP